MTKAEAARYLVELYSDYEHHAKELYYGTRQKYSEAIAIAIMALGEDDGGE